MQRWRSLRIEGAASCAIDLPTTCQRRCNVGTNHKTDFSTKAREAGLPFWVLSLDVAAASDPGLQKFDRSSRGDAASSHHPWSEREEAALLSESIAHLRFMKSARSPFQRCRARTRGMYDDHEHRRRR